MNLERGTSPLVLSIIASTLGAMVILIRSLFSALMFTNTINHIYILAFYQFDISMIRAKSDSVGNGLLNPIV